MGYLPPRVPPRQRAQPPSLFPQLVRALEGEIFKDPPTMLRQGPPKERLALPPPPPKPLRYPADEQPRGLLPGRPGELVGDNFELRNPFSRLADWLANAIAIAPIAFAEVELPQEWPNLWT